MKKTDNLGYSMYMQLQMQILLPIENYVSALSSIPRYYWCSFA